MQVIISLVAVMVLFLAGYVGAGMGLQSVFGVYLPYAAFALFLVGIVGRVLGWAKSPVPFRITTTCGQQKSLDWIKHDKYDNPQTSFQAAVRMILEVLFFRSLFRNTTSELIEGRRLVYTSNQLLWLGAMAFHWAFLIVLVRHLRLFIDKVPALITYLQIADGAFQVGVPVFYITSFILPAALAYLLIRRLASPQLRYISLINDYFPLFLLLGIALSGFWLRYIAKTDVISIKLLATGLAHFSVAGPEVLQNVSPLFFGHLFLVSVLMAYFPFSKLTHMAGVFLSPTRNLANNSRAVRHINPWNPEVKVHTYDEYEEEFGAVMKAAGVPLDKE